MFAADRVLRFDLELKPWDMAELAREPRDYVPAVLRFEDWTFEDVQARFKGNRAMESWSGKPAFKLRFAKKRRFFGLRRLVLNNMVEDPTMLREALGYRVFRAAGVAAPRTAYAELFVNGRRLGLHVVLEAVDESFLTHHFVDGRGPLYEGEFGCDLRPDDVPGLQLERGADPGRAAVAKLAAAAQGPAEALFWDPKTEVDTTQVIDFLAASTFLADFDGYAHSHNYRLFFDRGRGKWALLPWGLDRVMKQPMGVFDSDGVLARRCVADARCRVAYVQRLAELVAKVAKLELDAMMDRLVALTGEAVRADPHKPYDMAKIARSRKQLRAFVRGRAGELEAALSCVAGGKEVDRDGDGHGCLDCDDRDPKVHPGAAELCDGVDNDCNGLVDDGPRCPCPPLSIEDATFSLCDQPTTWSDAVRRCEQRGAVLARVDDEEQSYRLLTAASGMNPADWWIGLHDRKAEGRFEWVDGSSLTHALWADGEPDVHRCGEDCVALDEDEGGDWRDMHCEQRAPFICRRPEPRPPGVGR